MKTKILGLLALTFLIIGGCAKYQIVSDYDHEADFGKFKTFNFQTPKPNPNAPIRFSQINQNRLKHAITHQMMLHNYEKAPNPDLLISFYLKVDQKQGVYDYGPYYGYDYGWNDVSTYNYKEGTLTIDLVDTQRNRLVWQGSAMGVLPDNIRNVEEKIKNVVQKIFNKYQYLAGESKPVASKKQKK